LDNKVFDIIDARCNYIKKLHLSCIESPEKKDL